MKKFIAGLIIGLLFTNTFAFAGDSISAVFSNFNFVVNGQAKTISAQPIVYNGTSYLPVREVSTMLGYDVDYKADTRTIELKTAAQAAPADSQTDSINSNPNVSDLISANDLYSTYKVELSNLNGKDPATLKYNGKTVVTRDYVIVNERMYFNKSILNALGIDQ